MHCNECGKELVRKTDDCEMAYRMLEGDKDPEVPVMSNSTTSKNMQTMIQITRRERTSENVQIGAINQVYKSNPTKKNFDFIMETFVRTGADRRDDSRGWRVR